MKLNAKNKIEIKIKYEIVLAKKHQSIDGEIQPR